MPMTLLRHYRKLADECLQKAISSATAEMAEEWLRMAASWLAMVKFRQRLLARSSGLTGQPVGARQRSSTGSHC